MALYEFAASTRRLIQYSLIGLIVFALLLLAFIFALRLYHQLNPTTQAPTVGFGKLPNLRLLAGEIEGNPNFTLETPTGDLPKLDNIAPVVAMKPIQPTLLSEDKARQLAQELDFGGQGELSNDQKSLIFRDNPDKRTLTIDTASQNFLLETAPNLIAALPKGNAPSGPEAIKQAQDLLHNLGLLKFDFDTGTQTTVFRAVKGDNVVEANSISEAQFTEVNFFRSLSGVSAESFPILPPDYKTGLLQLWLTTNLSPSILNNLRISYNAWEIDKSRIETYPLKNVSAAWDQVKSKKGIALVSVSGSLEQISITQVSIAYFDDPIFQEYLQPIYVFSGFAKNTSGAQGDFVAYIQAVSDEWVKQ